MTELEAGLVEEWVSKVAGTYDFTVTSHKADIYGVCAGCAA